MGNRKQPFGYQIELGQIVIQPQESKVVKLIFTHYNSGDAYSTLVEMLKNQEVAYDVGKLWNKNMVARILEDTRYVGDSRYPAIITQKELDIAQEKRKKKCVRTDKSQTNKLLRQLSGRQYIEGMEQHVLNLLNSLILHPEQIQEKEKATAPCELQTMQDKLDELLNCQPIDEDSAKKLIHKIAATQYTMLGSSKYESERLRHLFSQREVMKELDAELLKNTVSEIINSGNGRICLRLKNKQIIGRSETR